MATYTDKELIKIEKQISKIYKQSQAEIQVKWDTYIIKSEKKIKKAKKAYEDAYLAPNLDPDKIKELKEQYQKAMYNATLMDNHYKAMVDQVTTTLANTNQIALNYVNNDMPPIYCHAYNEFEKQHIAGYSFETVNENAVRNLIKNGDKTLLPKKTVNIPKDKIWNTKNINSQVLQGIIQGESIPEIAKRLQTVTDMNHNAAVRNARTMATGAESKGHMDSFKRASNDGVIMKKVWVSTHDGRTRDWHADLNGKEVDVDEPFDSEYGEISYPGDPTAHPANVYNCRCAVRAKVIGFDWSKYTQKQKAMGEPVKKEPVIGKFVETYKGKSVTAQYYSMLNENKAVGNEFWKMMKAEGKPPELWKSYLDGTASKELVTKIDNVLAKYNGTGSPIKPSKLAKMNQKPKPDLMMYQDKSMTATYYSVLNEDKALGKEFLSTLKTTDNPPDTWAKYLIGKAPKDVTEKLDDILLQHKGTGAWKKPQKTVYALKPDFDVDDVMDIKATDPDTFAKIKGVFLKSDSEDTFGEFWKKYKLGQVKNDELDALLKDNIAVKKTKKAAEVKNVASQATKKAAATAPEVSTELETAKAKLLQAEDNLNSLENKTFSGIWKQDVTLADYEAKAGAIQAKKDYYLDQIKAIQENVNNGTMSKAVGDSTLQTIQNHLDDLAEFETKGPLYQQYYNEYRTAANEVKRLTPVSERFGPDAYVQARKDNAKWFTRSNYYEGDKYYDATMADVHTKRTQAEYRAYKDYTSASGGFNRPLVGFKTPYEGMGQSGWDPKYYVGKGKVDLNNEGKGEKIKHLTSYIEKSTTKDDIWIQTSQYFSTLEGKDGFLGIDYGTLSKMTDKQLEKFVGTTSEFPQFISGAINRGGGSYNPGSMRINIYVPEGSEALYVTDGTFGKGEHEIILQRGGTYRITRMYWGTDVEHYGEKILVVDMDLLTGYGYNKF